MTGHDRPEYPLLDVVFNEDRSTVRKDPAPQHMAIVRQVVLNILNTAKTVQRHWRQDYAKKAG